MDETETKPRTKVLKNGAVYDLDKKKIVANPGGGTAAFTTETSIKAKERRLELKRERLIAGAARMLERSGDWETPGDLDVVEALGEAVMMKALNPDNPKQVDAARFIMTEAGLSDRQANEQAAVQSAPADFVRSVTQLMALLTDTASARPAPEIVDGTVTDTRKD